MEYDPVCNMKVSKDSKFHSDFQGRTFFFCCEGCKSEFDSNPIKYSRK